MFAYPALIEKDTNGQYLATFPDIPEAASVGDSMDDALANSLDAIESALDFYFDDRRPVPAPSKVKLGQAAVVLPALVTAKILLHNEMVSQGVRKADLARRLAMAPSNVERIFNVRHSTKFETIEAAFEKLGKHIEIRVI